MFIEGIFKMNKVWDEPSSPSTKEWLKKISHDHYMMNACVDVSQ